MRTIGFPRLLKRERTADVRTYRTSRVNSQTMTTNMKSIIQAHFLSDL